MTADIVVVAKVASLGGAIDISAFYSTDHFYYEPYPYLGDEATTGEAPQLGDVGFRPVCDSLAGIAKATSDRIGAIAESAQFEYFATALGAGGGMYQLFLDRVSTIGEPGKSVFRQPESPASIAMFIHSHPPIPDDETDKINRYPSPVDWKNVENFVDGNKAEFPSVFNLQLAIRDPFGNVRTFSYAQRGTFKTLSDDQKKSGTALPSPITSSAGCTS